MFKSIISIQIDPLQSWQVNFILLLLLLRLQLRSLILLIGDKHLILLNLLLYVLWYLSLPIQSLDFSLIFKNHLLSGFRYCSTLDWVLSQRKLILTLTKIRRSLSIRVLLLMRQMSYALIYKRLLLWCLILKILLGDWLLYLRRLKLSLLYVLLISCLGIITTWSCGWIFTILK